MFRLEYAFDQKYSISPRKNLHAPRKNIDNRAPRALISFDHQNATETQSVWLKLLGEV